LRSLRQAKNFKVVVRVRPLSSEESLLKVPAACVADTTTTIQCTDVDEANRARRQPAAPRTFT